MMENIHIAEREVNHHVEMCEDRLGAFEMSIRERVGEEERRVFDVSDLSQGRGGTNS